MVLISYICEVKGKEMRKLQLNDLTIPIVKEC